MRFALLLYVSSLTFLYSNPSSEWIEDLAALKVKAQYYSANHKLIGGKYLPESQLIEYTSLDLVSSKESTDHKVSLLFHNENQEIPGAEKTLAEYLESEKNQKLPKLFLLVQKRDTKSLKVRRVLLCPLSLASGLIADKVEKIQKEKLSVLPENTIQELAVELLKKLDEMKLVEMGPATPTNAKALSIYPHGRLYPIEK